MYDFTDIEKYPVAVLGAGSVGRTCAADCKLAGNTVRLFDIQPFAEKSLKYLAKAGVTLEDLDIGHMDKEQLLEYLNKGTYTEK
ncbi:MAG: hypothetical protein J6I83_06755 [Firmicutes bacterium]|nr:hypothetical protein [Bacillota bacterium]